MVSKTNDNTRRVSDLLHGIISVQGRRMTMEDAHAIKTQFLGKNSAVSFFGIYDGHGGIAIANYCARLLHNYVREAFIETNNIEKSLQEGIEKTDRELANSSLFKILAQRCGSTVVVAVIDENTIYVAHVGDSRAVLARKDSILALTIDHKPSHPQEKERIERGGGIVIIDYDVARVGGTLAISRAIGDHAVQGVIAAPDIISIQRQPHDEFLLLACDGIFEAGITHERAVEIVRNSLNNNHSNPNRAHLAAEKLVQEAYESGSEDNLTAIVILLN